jgi:hypothetical protein
MNINVQIEQLVLDGINISQAQRPLLQAAVEAELGRLLADGGLSPALAGGAALPSVPAANIELGQQAAGPYDNGRLGRQIAQAVYGGIGR